MKTTTLTFITDLPTYISEVYGDCKPKVILPNYCCGFDSAKSFYHDFYSVRCQLIVYTALHLIRFNFDPRLAPKLVKLLINDIDGCRNIRDTYGDKFSAFIEEGKELYVSQLQRYVSDIVSNSITGKPCLLVAFDKSHPLIDMISVKKRVDNCEMIFITHESAQHFNNISRNRRILLTRPETWHESDYQAIQGIKVKECNSLEAEVSLVRSFVKEHENSAVIIDDCQLLHRLSLSLDGFSYDKMLGSDAAVRIMLNSMDRKCGLEFLEESQKDLLLQTDIVDAHLDSIGGLSLSTDAKQFISLVKKLLKDIRFRSPYEYRSVFKLLSQEILYRAKGKINAITSNDYNLNSEVAIVATRNWKNNAAFTQLMGVKKLFVIHNTNQPEPEWLGKLKVLLSGSDINSYALPKLDLPEYVPVVVNPSSSSRPKSLSATMIEVLMRDPYVFYVRYILRLVPESSQQIHFGIFVHQILALYHSGMQSEDEVLEYAEAELKKYVHITESQSLWWVKLKKIIHNFIEQYHSRNYLSAYSERSISFNLSGYNISVTCDRIEFLPDNTIAILEYKTGAVPSTKDIVSGYSPQLILQAIAAREKFQKEVSELAYWQLKADKIVVKKITDISSVISGLLEVLEPLLLGLSDMEFKSTGYYKDYQHFARIREVLD